MALRARRRLAHPVFGAVALHAAIWSLAPLLYIANMHSDTTEIIYWGRDWALSYPKHPPLAPVLLDLVFKPGSTAIFRILLFGQACVIVSAIYVWRAARMLAGEAAGVVATICFLASPMATFFAVQVNHNSILEPFWAASLFYGLRYLREGRTRDAIALAIAGGAGALVKYEIAFLLLSLPLMAAFIPAYRHVLWKPATYGAIALFAAIIAPHVWWLLARDSSTVAYALSARRIHTAANALASVKDFLIGHLTVLVGPLMALAALRARLPDLRWRRGAGAGAVAATFLPSVLLALGGALTGQDIRQGWVLPLSANLLVGGAALLRKRTGADARPITLRHTLLAVAALALLNNALFAGFLHVRAWRHKPIEAFDLDAHLLARRIEAIWAANHGGPLACIVIDTRRSSAALLWLRDRPRVVNIADPYWSSPAQVERCAQTGAVAVLHEDAEDSAAKLFCMEDEVETNVPSALRADRNFKMADLFYIPPKDGPPKDGPCAPYRQR